MTSFVTQSCFGRMALIVQRTRFGDILRRYRYPRAIRTVCTHGTHVASTPGMDRKTRINISCALDVAGVLKKSTVGATGAVEALVRRTITRARAAVEASQRLGCSRRDVSLYAIGLGDNRPAAAAYEDLAAALAAGLLAQVLDEVYGKEAVCE